VKKIIFIFSVLLFLTNLRAENTNESVGAWSEVVNGLRGRLIVTQEKEENGVQRPKVFLELQNIDDVLNPIQVNAFDPQTSFQCRILDSAGKSVASAPIGIREMILPALTLVIPFESSLRLNVNRHRPGGWFFAQVPSKERIEIVLGDGVWVIEKASRADYLLEGTFHIEKSKPTTSRNWSGTLKIPGVKIPR
jgi:hypothetical protein